MRLIKQTSTDVFGRSMSSSRKGSSSEKSPKLSPDPRRARLPASSSPKSQNVTSIGSPEKRLGYVEF